MNRIKYFLLLNLAAPLAYLLLWLLCATVRLRVEGAEHEETLDRAGKPGILSCWHGRLLYLPYFFSAVRGKSGKIDVLASPSQDGEFVARVSSLFGYGVARGSSYKNPRTALRDLARRTAQGRWPGIIADGSRGPVFKAQPGSIMLSKLTGAPVAPITVSFDRCWTLKSWDRMIIPKPFCRGVVIYGQPIWLPSGAGREEMDIQVEALEKALIQITETADAYFKKS